MSPWPFNNWLSSLDDAVSALPEALCCFYGQGEGLRHGEFSGALLEPGVDVEESRIYQLGDSVRHINWRLTARSDQVFVKYQTKPTEVRARLLIDLRDSAWQGTRLRLKAEQIVRVAFYVARTLAKVMVVDSQIWSSDAPNLPVLRGLSRWHSWCEAWPPLLAKMATDPSNPALPLADALLNTNAQNCVVVSDLLDWDDALETRFLETRQRGQVILIHVLDSADVSLPQITGIQLGEKALSLSAQDQILAYEQQMRAYCDKIRDWCAVMDIDYHPLWADAELTQLAVQSSWSQI
ncbi:MAG: DUF58 domain-containing protein [Thiotrichales bacterium]|nr:DUF58 domain-containing protein [Thiotrichales bacterium]